MTDRGNGWNDQKVDPKVFMKLARKILPYELLELADSLGIDIATLQTIKADERDHKAMVHRLLRTWYQSNYDEATIRVLNTALEDIGRSDLIELTDSRGSGNSGPTSSRAIDTRVFTSDAPTGDSATPPADMHYAMESKPRVKCFILGYSFKGDVSENLKTIFGKCLGFDVEHYRDLDLKSTRRVLKEMSEKYHGDCFVLFVLSHGDEEGFFTSDNKKMSFQEVNRRFDVNLCASLARSPKIFFVNVCRSDASNVMTHYIPSEADGGVVPSTIQRYESLRPAQEGSFSVEISCELSCEIL